MGSRLEEIKARWTAALPGPWHWSGFAKHPRAGSPRVALVTSHSGQKYIICADPEDGLMLRCPEGPGLAPAVEVAECMEHNGVITGMKDPNATAIAAAPEDVRWLVERVEAMTKALTGITELIDSGRMAVGCTCYSIGGCEYCSVVGGALIQARKALVEEVGHG